MVEKADGNDSNETPKPSMMARLLRFGRNGAPDKGSARIDRNKIGLPTRMRTNGFFGVSEDPSQDTPDATRNPRSNPAPTQARGPDINKPLPPLPREMMAEAKAISPAGGPSINDQTVASRITPRRDNPGRTDVAAGAAETSPKVALRPKILNASPVHRLGSHLSNIPEGTGLVGRLPGGRPSEAAQTIDVKAVRAEVLSLPRIAAARRGAPMPPVDGAIEIAQASVPNRPPQIRDPSPANFETPPAVSPAKGNQRSGVSSAKGIYKLVPSLAPIQEEPGPVTGKSQPPPPLGRPVVSAEDLTPKPGVEPARRSLFSFVAETSPNPVNRRLVPIVKNTGSASVDKVVMNHTATSVENQADHSTKTNRDAPPPLVAKKNEPSALRGLDAHRNDSHSR